MSVNLSPVGGAASQFFDNNGVILSGGKIYTYAAGTTTPQTTYTSVSGATPHANPIVLDSAGRVPGGEIWLNIANSYKFVIETSLGVLIGTYDNLSATSALLTQLTPYGYTTADNVQSAFDDLGSNTGANFVGFIQDATSAVSRSALNKLRETISVQDFGAVGDGVADDTSAIQAAINYAEELASNGTARGVNVYFLPGIYRVTSTLTITESRIGLVGAGRYKSIIRRNTSYGNTLNVSSGAGLLEQMNLYGLSFYHDISTGVAMTGVHVVWDGVTQGRIEQVSVENGEYGIGIYGGVDTVLDQVDIIGRNSGTAGHNGAAGLILDVNTTGAVVLPTQIRGHSVRIFGPRITGWNNGLQVNAAEDVSFESCYFGNAKTHNVLFNQTQPAILEVSFGPGCYFDAAGNHSVNITGIDGDGSSYIGNTKFIGCNFKGQSGDGNNGLFIDGTPRVGTYTQAARGVTVEGCTISSFNENGVWANGGNNIRISNCDIGGNNYFNTTGGRGILIDAAVNGAMISNNRIGRNPEWSDIVSYQVYGIELVTGCKYVVICDNDVRQNYTGGILDGAADAGTSYKQIVNNPGFNGGRAAASPTMPSSGTTITNPYGSPAWVSIYGGIVTEVLMNNGIVQTSTNVMFAISPGDTLRLTYSSTPSWVWWPQ